MPRLIDPDPELPTLFSATEARARGLSRDQIRHRLRSGAWERVGRGMYRRTALLDDADLDMPARERIDHVHRAVAAARANRGCVIGLHSAAMVHGLPLFERLPREVSLLVPMGHWTGRRSGVSFVRGIDLVLSAGLSHVTDPASTWIGIARRRGLADALCVGDAALRRGLMTVAELELLVERGVTGPGHRRVRLALGHLDARRESPLESGSWSYFVQHRLPLPEPQVVVCDAGGAFVARVDFAWDHVIGECDGAVKYDSREVLYEEKRREDSLRSLGLTVVRWGMADLRSDRLASRLKALLR